MQRNPLLAVLALALILFAPPGCSTGKGKATRVETPAVRYDELVQSPQEHREAAALEALNIPAAQQTVGVGSAPNDGTGDALRTAFTKLNANDTELYADVATRLVTTNGTAVGLTLSGSTTNSALTASKGVFTSAAKVLTSTGTLGVDQGGTGTGTSFTSGSIVFAGASGVYSQDNASAFWDDTNNRIGLSTTEPKAPLHIVMAGAYNTESINAIQVWNAASGAPVTVGVNIGVDNALGIGYMQVMDPGDSFATKNLTLQAAGANVGIGTTAPLAKLAVNGGANIGADADPGDNNLNVVGLTTTGTLTSSGVVTVTNGNLLLGTAGNGLQIKEGSNARMGTATLSGGTIAVSNTSAATGDRIFIQRVSGTAAEFGHLSYTISNGVSFTINSTDAQDDSVVNWLIIKPTP